MARKRKYSFEEQVKLVEYYLLQNCTQTGYNFQKTTYTWIKEIEEWAGADINWYAFIDTVERLAISSKEIVKGVNIYNLKNVRKK